MKRKFISWLQNILGVKQGMKIQFRILKQMGPDDYLVHICTPAISEAFNPQTDPWCHLGVIAMTKTQIEKIQKKGLEIIWTRDY